jgi:hypothetical protein
MPSHSLRRAVPETGDSQMVANHANRGRGLDLRRGVTLRAADVPGRRRAC